MRAASFEELDDVAAMANAAYSKSEGHVFAGTTRTQRDDLMRRREDLTVAEVDGRVSGCIHIDVGGATAHFGLLATDVSVQGMGIGSRLIAFAEDRAREAGHAVMRIETVQEAGLVRFYERRGYHRTGEVAGQVWNGGEDWGAVIAWHMVEMEKRLT